MYSQNLYVEEPLEKEALTEVGLGPGLIRWHVQYYCSMDTLHLPENHCNNHHLLRLYCKSQAFPSLVPFSPYKRQYICSYVVDGKLRRRVFMLFNITAVEHIAGSCQGFIQKRNEMEPPEFTQFIEFQGLYTFHSTIFHSFPERKCRRVIFT